MVLTVLRSMLSGYGQVLNLDSLRAFLEKNNTPPPANVDTSYVAEFKKNSQARRCDKKVNLDPNRVF